MDEFIIPLPPPEDMESHAVTRAAAQLSVAASLGTRSRYTLREVNQDDYLQWFGRVGQPHLFSMELRESQQVMWFAEDWAQGFEERLSDFYVASEGKAGAGTSGGRGLLRCCQHWVER